MILAPVFFRYCVQDVEGDDRFQTIAQATVAVIAIHALIGNPAQSLPIKFG